MVDRLQRWRGWRVKDVHVDGRMTIAAAKKYLPGDEYNDVIGQCITDVCRRGKFIVFLTSSGALLCHNAMSGYWDSTLEPWTFDYVEGKRTPAMADVRVELQLESGEGDVWTLRFHDARMFGSLRFVSPGQLAAKLDMLGPEALNTAHAYQPLEMMTDQKFDAVCQSKKAIKEVITDQSKIVGVGNIYAAEALWLARIDPRRSASILNVVERARLLSAVRDVMQQAIDRKLDYDGLKVYRRKQCPTCASPVAVEEIKGRKTYWCSTCQK